MLDIIYMFATLGDCIYQLLCCGGRKDKRQIIIDHIEDLAIDEYNDIMRYIRINNNKNIIVVDYIYI